MEQTTKTENQTEEVAPQVTEDDDYGLLEGAYDTLAATGKGIVEGTIVQPAEMLEENFGSLGRVVLDDNWMPHYLSPEEERMLDIQNMPTYLEGITELTEDQQNNAVAEFGHTVGQFVAPFMLVPGSGVVASGVKAMGVDFASFDPDEGKLGDTLLELGVPAEYINEMFLTDPDDTDAWNRLEQALEGLGLGIAAGAVLRGVMGIRSAGKKLANEATEEAAETAAESVSPAVAPKPTKRTENASVEPEMASGDVKASKEFAAQVKNGIDPLADQTGPDPFKQVPARIIDDANVNRVTGRVRELFTNIISKGYDKDVYGRFANALTQRAKDNMNMAAKSMFRALEKGDYDGAIRAIDRMGNFPGSDATMKAAIKRIVTREAVGLVWNNAEAYFKTVKEQGFNVKTDPVLRDVANQKVGMIIRLLKEARAEGRVSSAALRSVGENVSPVWDDNNLLGATLQQIDEVADDLVKQYTKESGGDAAKAAVKPKGTAVKRTAANDALEAGLQEALDLQIDLDEIFSFAREYAEEMAKHPGIPKDAAAKAQMAASATEKIFAFLKEAYITNILSSPKTIAANIVGTLTNTAIRPMAKAVGGVVSGDAKMAKLAMREMTGYMYASREAMRFAWQAGWKRSGALENFDTRQLNSSGGMLDPVAGQFVRNSLKRLWTFAVDIQLGTDEFHKQLRYRGIRYARAHQRAEELGLNAKETKKFVDEYVQKGFDAQNRANDPIDLAEAKAAAFQTPWENRLGAVGKGISGLEKIRGRDDMVGLMSTVVFPFVRTPTNLITEMATYMSPTAFYPQNTKFFKMMNGDMGPEATAIARGKFLIGMSTMATMYGLYSSGAIGFTGHPQTHWAKGKQQRETLPPFSIILGGTAYPLSNFAPFSAPLLAVASITQANYWADEASRALPSEDMDRSYVETVMPLALASISVVSEAPMFTGLQRLFDLGSQFYGSMSTGDWKRTHISAAYMLAGFTTPGQLKWANRTFNDDIQKEAETVMDVFLKELPWTGAGIPKRDVLGNIMEHSGNLLRGVEYPSSPGYYLLNSLLHNPVTNKEFELKGPKDPFKKSGPLAKLTEGSIDLTKVPIGDKSAWEVYQDYMFTGKAPKDRVKKYRDSPHVTLFKANETLEQSIERLASDPTFMSLNPLIQVKVVGDIYKERRGQAKAALSSNKEFKKFMDERKGIDTRRKSFLKENPFADTPQPTGLRAAFPEANSIFDVVDDFKNKQQ